MPFRILIIDDEEIIRQGLCRAVRKFNPEIHLVGTAANGEEALSLYNANPGIELILLDINIPRINGLELVEIIQKKDKLCKIIIISGYSKFSYAQRALSLGVFDYLLKPVNQASLEKVLKKAMASYQDRLWEITELEKREGESPKGIEENVENAINYIIRNFTNIQINLNSVAKLYNVSSSYMSRLIKQKTGMSFSDYLGQLRLEQAINLLESNKPIMIYEIADRVGFSSQHYFSRAFKEFTGLSPTEYRAKKNRTGKGKSSHFEEK